MHRMNGQSFNQNMMAPQSSDDPAVASYPRVPRQRTQLPDDFVPSDDDIICGRGKESHAHIGNKRFRETISFNVDRYLSTNTKVEKSLVVMSIVNEIRGKTPNGGFVKKDEETGKWYEIGDQLAKEKVGHALRDLIAGYSRKRSKNDKSERRPSSGKKRARRKIENTTVDGEDALCDEFFTNFVVDTFLGKKSEGDQLDRHHATSDSTITDGSLQGKQPAAATKRNATHNTRTDHSDFTS